MSNVVPFQGGIPPTALGNVVSEALLLGALLIDNSRVTAVSEILDATHFYEPLHGRIFSKIIELIPDSGAVTAATLRPYFEGDEALAELGGITYLARLTADGQGLLATTAIAEQIRDLAWRREARDGLLAAAENCLDLAIGAEEIASQAEAKITLPEGPSKSNGALLPGVVDPIALGAAATANSALYHSGLDRARRLWAAERPRGRRQIADRATEATCAAHGCDFLGLEISQVPTIYITCEDPIDELWRRQENINAALGSRWRAYLVKFNWCRSKASLATSWAPSMRKLF